MTTALTKGQSQGALAAAPLASNVPMMNPETFDHMYRVGKMMGMSPLFPDHLRKGGPEAAAANGMLVVNMAMRLNEDPLTVAQQIYFVGGKPGWNTTYMIARANQSGVFTDQIDWKIEGRKGDNLSVTAFAKLAGTGRDVSVTCDMAMAKAEGWTSNKKYQSIPEQMLRYRSAAFLIRLYAPEVMIGVPAAIEVELSESEYRDITPREEPEQPDPKPETETPAEKPAPARKAKPAEKPAPEPEDAQIAEDDGEDEAKAEAAKAEAYQKLERAAEDVVADIHDAPSPGAAMDFHQDTMKRLDAEAPDLAKWVREEADTAKKAGDGNSDGEGDGQAESGRKRMDYSEGGEQDPGWSARMSSTIIKDLNETAGDDGVDEVLDLYKQEVAEVQKGDPSAYSEIMTVANRQRKEA